MSLFREIIDSAKALGSVAFALPQGRERVAQAAELEQLWIQLKMLSTDPEPLLARAERRVVGSIERSRSTAGRSLTLAESMRLEIEHLRYGGKPAHHWTCAWCLYEATCPTPPAPGS